MKKNYNLTKIFLAFIFLFQAFFINACGIVNLANNPTNNLKAFSKKSVPDPLLCSNTENLGVSVSNSKLYAKNIVTITTNIPPKFDEILTVLGQPQIKYKVKIEKINSASFFEKEVTSGCTSFDWDGNDNKGIRLESDEYKVNIYVSYDSFYRSYLYSFKDFYDQVSTKAAYCNGSIIKLFTNNTGYVLPYCDNGVGRELFTADEFAKQIDSTNIELVDIEKEPTPLDPATTRFFEVEDFKKLSDYANQLTIDDSQANELYNQAKLLDVYQKEKISLLARSTINQAKIDAINSKIQSANDSITALQGSVMVQLSDLYNKAYNLANHVNTITESQYITPYPPEEKPTTSSEYYDRGYYVTENVLNALEDGAELYIPDENDPIQDKFKQTWEVESTRPEVIQVNQALDGSKYLFEEIQTAKDLNTDILNSTFIDPSDKIDAIKTLSDYVREIKKHSGFLKTRSKFIHQEYKDNFEKVRLNALKIQLSIIIPLAEAMQDIDSGDEFRIQALKTKDLASDVNATSEYIADYVVLVVNILDRPVYGEKSQSEIARKWEGKSKKEWDDLSAGLRDEMIQNRMDLLRASIVVPVTYFDVAMMPFMYGKTTLKGAKVAYGSLKTAIINPKVIGSATKKVLTADLKKTAGYFLPKVVENLSAKNLANKLKNLPCFKTMAISSFHTEAIELRKPSDCFLQVANYVFAEVKQRIALAGASGKYTINYIFENNTSISKAGLSQIIRQVNNLDIQTFTRLLEQRKVLVKLDDSWPDWKKTLHGEIAKVYQEFFKNGGVTIREINIGYIKAHAPDFEVLAKNVTVEIQGMNGKQSWGAIETTDFGKATESLITKLNLNGVSKNQVEDFFRDTLKVTWHHHEGLKKMVLIPSKIHSGGTSPHWGAKSIIDRLNELDISVRSKSRTIWEENFKSLYP